MYRLRETLSSEASYLEYIIQRLSETPENEPEGSLWISKSQNHFRLYQHTDNKKTYISRKNTTLPKALAQKGYRLQTLQLARKRKKQIDQILSDYQDDEIAAIYRNMHPVRRQLVKPIVRPFEEVVEEWKNEPYQKNEYHPEKLLFTTENGESVRSKSEVILADFFHKNGLIYKYEKPLTLRGVGVIYPDFTFLSPLTQKEIYWEHFGMMDNAEYAESVLEKIEKYGKGGIFVDSNLICTYESSKHVLKMDMVRHYVDAYLR